MGTSSQDCTKPAAILVRKTNIQSDVKMMAGIKGHFSIFIAINVVSLRSWWYKFCVKCRGEDESLPSWEPRAWPRFCPYPFFPTYRQFSRVVCLVLIGFLSWCAIYSIVGKAIVACTKNFFKFTGVFYRRNSGSSTWKALPADIPQYLRISWWMADESHHPSSPYRDAFHRAVAPKCWYRQLG